MKYKNISKVKLILLSTLSLVTSCTNNSPSYESDIWVVYWNSYNDGVSPEFPELKQSSRAFLNENDAVKFKERLEESLEVLQFYIDLDIKIEKQK